MVESNKVDKNKFKNEEEKKRIQTYLANTVIVYRRCVTFQF